MAEEPMSIILYKGGRLPSWYRLGSAEKAAIEQEHVDLMLSVARLHGLRRLDGYRLLAPQGAWERFWIIAFPTQVGAEAWIAAEMSPPYGRFGFYDYQLARPLPITATTISPLRQAAKEGGRKANPQQIPLLDVDRSRLVVFVFETDQFQEPPDLIARPALAEAHGVRRLEGFQLLAPSAAWRRVWQVVLPSLEAAERWIEAIALAGQADQTERAVYLTRPWAPDYFDNWIAH